MNDGFRWCWIFTFLMIICRIMFIRWCILFIWMSIMIMIIRWIHIWIGIMIGWWCIWLIGRIMIWIGCFIMHWRRPSWCRLMIPYCHCIRCIQRYWIGCCRWRCTTIGSIWIDPCCTSRCQWLRNFHSRWRWWWCRTIRNSRRICCSNFFIWCIRWTNIIGWCIWYCRF